ncbi:MAG: HD domain-containing protein [Prevotella sp.]|nr:HD domain-containing protein [Prevotella sp.]
MDYQKVIDYFYGNEDSALKTILVVHSRGVAEKALAICAAHPELSMDSSFVEAAAMLHDIGIIRCNAPGIECFGTEPYICHGRIGAVMLRHELPIPHSSFLIPHFSIDPFARVCERHTGAGLTKEEIMKQNLPLPHQDFLPETMEEKVICYADKFFSKTRPEEEKSFDHVLRSLAKFGSEGVERFLSWHQLFAVEK